MHVNGIHPEADHPLSWLAENMRFLRRKHGLGQSDLATMAQTSINNIKKLESGKKGTSIATLAIVFAALDDLDQMTEILDIAVDDIGLMRDQFDAPKRIGRKKSIMNSFTPEQDDQKIKSPSP